MFVRHTCESRRMKYCFNSMAMDERDVDGQGSFSCEYLRRL